MDFEEYAKIELEKFKNEEFWGIYAEGYEEGVDVSANPIRLPRQNTPFIEISSTLLIPEKYYTIFRRKIIEHQGVRAYVAHLLLKYKVLSQVDLFLVIEIILLNIKKKIRILSVLRSP